MLTNNKFRAVLLGCAAVALLGACSGSDGVASPGVGAFVPPPSAPPPAPPPPPPAPPPATGGPAADCPADFSNVGVISDNRICQLPSRIEGNLVVPKRDGTVYSISGRTEVGRDLGADPNAPDPNGVAGVLTIEPGVTIFGDVGLNYILVNRGSQIFAEGTADEPIIMTSRERVEGTATENTIGRWGGLVINGRAPTTDGCAALPPPDASCEAQVEGSNAFFGGNSPSDSSGRIRYLQLSYSGWRIAPDNELNGITFAGVGNGTTVDHVQVHNSSDDGIEIFGGNLNLSHLVLTGNDDESFDTDSGWRGAAQFGIVYQRADGGDYGWETSSAGTNTATYFSRPTYANWTVVMRDASTRDGIIHNSGHTARVYNSVIRHPGAHQCLQISGADTMANPNGVAGNGPLYNSVFFSCEGGNVEGSNGTTTPDVETLINAGANNVLDGVSTLINGFINGDNENAVTASAFPDALNDGDGLPANSFITDFLEPVDYIGAVRDETDNWYEGWTCSLPGQATCH